MDECLVRGSSHGLHRQRCRDSRLILTYLSISAPSFPGDGFLELGAGLSSSDKESGIVAEQTGVASRGPYLRASMAGPSKITSVSPSLTILLNEAHGTARWRNE